MIQKIDLSEADSKNSLEDENNAVVEHVRLVVTEYLKRRPHLSVNAISKRCNVSEPTLRRIMTRKVKTIPQITTLLDILTFISDTSSVREIVKIYPGPIADHLSEAMPYLEDLDQDYSNAVNEEIKDPVKYIIYKLSLNSNGVTVAKVRELYGNHGIHLLKDLIEKDFVYQDDFGICRARCKTFAGSHDEFVKNFKVAAEFIKPQKLQNRKPLNPYFVNMSESITPEAYEQIRRLQRKLDKKVRGILSQPESKGKIPFFYLGAIDTLDPQSAYEIAEEDH